MQEQQYGIRFEHVDDPEKGEPFYRIFFFDAEIGRIEDGDRRTGGEVYCEKESYRRRAERAIRLFWQMAGEE
jgi:hypothetical protein